MPDSKLIKNYCEYLSFRSFYTGFPVENISLPVVNGVDEAIARVKQELTNTVRPALLLSGGMDSAVLLPFMPEGSTAYTIYHDDLDNNEIDLAKRYCDKYSVNHVSISIDPEEYLSVVDELMINKKMPLSPAEPIFYLASKKIRQDGFEEVVTGGAADANFGGFPRFRKHQVSFHYQKELQRKYLRTRKILNNTVSLNYIFDQYVTSVSASDVGKRSVRSLSPRKRDRYIIDTKRFLREVGVERYAYDNAITLAGCKHVAPYSQFVFDFDEKKNELKSKYLIWGMYLKIYEQEPPEKFALQKPIHILNNYRPRNFEVFKSDIDMTAVTYSRKFLIYSLERFEALRLDGKV